MQEDDVYLVLGCFGRKEGDFVFCPSAENFILKIDENLIYYNEIWEYLESVGLVDKPMLNINAIMHLVYNLQERYDQKVKKLWTESKFNNIEKFIQLHKSCGLYAKLLLVENSSSENINKNEDNIIFIQKTDQPQYKVPVSKVIRSRK